MAAEAPADSPAPAAPGADDDEETGPVRRCIATGRRLPKERLIRFVIGPDGAAVPDLAGVLPGRGLSLTASRDMVALAVRKHAFERAARRPVTVAPDLADRIEALLAARCVEAIGLSRRSGGAVAGFEKVRAALRSGEAGLLLAASDGAEGGLRKIASLASGLPAVAVLTAAELGTAFGREHVVHAVVAPGRLAERLRIDADRLAGFRGLPPGNVPDRGAEDRV